MFGYIVLVLTMPILTRLYSPASFGDLSFYLSAVGLVSVVASGKFELKIAPAKTLKQAKGFVAITIIYSIIFLLLTSLLVAITKLYVYDFESGVSIHLVVLGALLIAVYNALINFNLFLERYILISQTNASRTILTSLMQLFLTFMTVNSMGLILGDVVGRLAGLRILSIKIMNDFVLNLKELFVLFKAHFKESFIVSIGWFLNNSAIHMIPIYIYYKYGHEAAGLIFIIQRVFSLPELIISKNVNLYFTGKYSSLLRLNDAESAAALLSKFIFRLFMFAIIATSIIWIILSNYFGLIFGDGWSLPEGLLLSISLIYFTQYFSSPFYIALNLKENSYIQSVWDLTRFISISFVLIYFYFYQVDVEMFLLVYGLVISLFNMVLIYLLKK